MQVLVVDDSVEIRQTFRMVLEEEAFTVEEAENGAVALQQIQSCRVPQVVLLDLWMPVLDGEEVLRQVASDAVVRARTGFILMTASQRTLPLKFMNMLDEMGVEFMPKPPPDLETIIRYVKRAAKRLNP